MRKLDETTSFGKRLRLRSLYDASRNRTSPVPPTYRAIGPNDPCSSVTSAPPPIAPLELTCGRSRVASTMMSTSFHSAGLMASDGRGTTLVTSDGPRAPPPARGAPPRAPARPRAPAAAAPPPAGAPARPPAGVPGAVPGAYRAMPPARPSGSRVSSLPFASSVTAKLPGSSASSETNTPFMPLSVFSARSSTPVLHPAAQLKSAPNSTS